MYKKLLIIVLFCLIFLVIFSGGKYESRNSKKVNDVNKGYSVDEWVVSPEEEPQGDEQVNNAPECDIRGVISCYDDDQLRVDILLTHQVSYKFTVWYAIKFEYTDEIHYYTYYPKEDKLFFEIVQNGEITKSEELGEDSKDYAGVTSSGDKESGSVYIIIDKDLHIGGDKGKRYYLTTTIFSGVNNNNEMKVADEAMTVNLFFVK